jgi:glycosyltransferase involved in cell wall biosynthesis
VTIGLPVYNGMPWLPEALHSALAQTFADLEVVVADNGSTDETEAFCRDLAARDPRLRYERSEVNRGAAYNYNRVLELARGDYFKWFADDDLCDPELVEQSVAVLDARPGVSLVYPRTRFIDANGATLSTFDDEGLLARWPRDPVARGRRMLEALFDREHGLDAICTVGVFGLTRTAVLRRIRPMGAYHGADWTIVMELALAGEVVQLPGSLSAIRRHEGAVSWQNFQDVSRADYAASQQAFHDPARRGWLAAELGLWRHYWELAAAIVTAPQPRANRLRLLASYLAMCGVRLGRRALSLARSHAGR